MGDKCALDNPCVHVLACLQQDPGDLLDVDHTMSGPHQSQ